ncbi:cytochrome P450 [Paraphoma chrysanthemicola]|uniref:Cytochrome P450 n=1 Tax=Paraphoma chrysanthemicola TaxID=798071 RepID=A0A8K0W0U3_9PLEO|nr:cytochrome P450 [Paraphoma chrysanthemicola]
MMDLFSVTPKQLASTVVAVYLLFFILTSIYRACTSPLRHIPGPCHTRFSNIVLFWQVMAGQRSFYINSLHEKYGPTVRLSPTEADFMDAESFKKIHHVNSRFVKDPWYEAVSFLPRLTIFNERDPKSHGERRKLLARHLGANQIRQNFERQVRELCVLCIRKMRTKSKENAEVDLLDWARLVCSDILGQVVFGAPFGMLELERRTEHIRVLDMALLFDGFTSEMPWLRTIGSRLPFKAFKEGYGSVDFIMDGAQVAVDNARSSADGQPRTVLASVLQEQRNDQDKLRQWDDTDIKVEALSLLIAGAGATATVLGFIWWQILELPDLRQSLETEVAALPDDFNDAMLETQCPLLSATILEGNRLRAGVPSSLPRLAPPGVCHLGGYFVPGGTTVGTQAYSMHGDATVWPDPLKLSPGRFLPGADIHPDAKSLLSGFGAGAYACLGPTLAKMNMRYMTAMLLKEFRGLKLSTKMGKLEEKNLITWIASFQQDDKILADFGEVEYRGKD